MSHLATALRLSLEFRTAGRTDIDAFLAEHDDLREFIEPMIRASTADPLPAARDRIAVGTVLGDYRLESVLGRGGMGTVFRARQSSLGREVALKVLSAPLALANERAFWRFQREARLLASLDHRNIVKVFEAGIEADVPYYAMELVAGAPLNQVLAAVSRSGLPGADGDTVQAAVAGTHRGDAEAGREAGLRPVGYVARMVEIAAQVADALACAHAAGVIHRDVKPGNVLLRCDGRALLADFGVAHCDSAPGLTMTGDFAGTLTYMSPEQTMGKAVDHRTDVFSLGTLLYEALTLRLPFEADDRMLMLDRLQHADPIDPARHNPAVPDDLSAVVQKALVKDPAERYQTAGAFGADLRAFLAGRPVTARRPTAPQRLRRWARREPWRATALGIAVAFAIALIAVTATFTVSLLREGERTRTALEEVNRLAIGVRIEQAERSARAFRNARAGSIPAMERWLRDEGERLERELPGLHDLLATVRGRALPYGEQEAAADRASHPEAEGWERLERERAHVEEQAAQPADPKEAEAIRQRREEMAALREPLLARISARRTWRFELPETQFLHDQIVQLLARLQQFAEPGRGTLARVRTQLAWARESQRRCLEEGAEVWRQAIAAIAADPRYGGLRLSPQYDLLPLDIDPRSRLWEFLHLRSGRPGHQLPARREDGSIRPGDDMGIVFVLLPGGRFTMGAQAQDPDRSGYDRAALPHEAPVHAVELAPFFLAKYETTQAQWRRLTAGDEPSYYAGQRRPAGPALTAHNPVESVSQEQALEVLADHGLTLPTEAQWEYACRAGTTTPFGFGDRALAPRYANLADATAKAAGATWSWCETDLSDGHVVHAPVGSFLPNAFGLHDMHGNVAELTLDLALPYERRALPGDGRREPFLNDIGSIMQRGGGFNMPLVHLRASDRSLSQSRQYRSDALGVRAARRIEQ